MWIITHRQENAKVGGEGGGGCRGRERCDYS